MIYTGTLLRIDTPSVPGPGGGKSIATGTAIQGGCRCLVSEPTQRDVYSGLGEVLEGSLILRLLEEELAAALKLAGIAVPATGARDAIYQDCRLLVQSDPSGGAAAGPQNYYRVRNVVRQSKGSRSIVVAELRDK